MFGKSPSHNRPTNEKSGVFRDLSRLLLCTAMNEGADGSMLSVVASSLCRRVSEKLTARMPRVVSDQRAKFDNDELFRKLSRESEVRVLGNYTPGSVVCKFFTWRASLPSCGLWKYRHEVISVQ